MTGIVMLSRADSLQCVARSLGLPGPANLDNALIAQSLRRTVFIAAPCSARVACALVVDALRPLVDDPEELRMRVDDVIDSLIAMGDLLEMRSEITGETNLVLRPAPPAFVQRRDGTFIVLGVAGDEITPSQAQDFSLLYRPSGLRTLAPPDAQPCRRILLDLGLIELPMPIWLHAPATVTAKEFVRSWVAKLPDKPHPEKIENLEVLDTSVTTSYYKRRWRPLNERHAGIFVSRRPQRYGANLWSLTEVQDGLVHRFIDIHPRDVRFRDCDEAWRLQAALDTQAGTPQRVKVEHAGEKAVVSFTSPLPTWAVRRLSLIGERVTPPRALLGFALPSQNCEDELRWLEKTLWLARDQGGTA
ncbi:hypothetical protein BN873_950010 [Candidatus Competibacter denitrificans Run_A_D11]|uniref:Uncharacterized protein n=1 Tax=Candidatus Competibacter denitrificans Run_A_D11 TaxID=1400863 RepID=W6M9M4_9GAMM|nr:hypothetical protein [Candidatus Competibacter denitrificans]CDI04327.1 hypothetical protein BN873_950010 [Candidatus Competibacter denitrificans Run_A_D11]